MRPFLITIFFVSLCCLSTGIALGQTMQLNVDFVYWPGLEEKESEHIDVQVDILLDDKVKGSALLTSYPTQLRRQIENPDNTDVFLKVRITSPDGWRMRNDDPILYDKFNKEVWFRRVDDLYFIRYSEAEKNVEAKKYAEALKVYQEILEDQIFTTENQKLEIMLSVSRINMQSGDFRSALENNFLISQGIAWDQINTGRKKMFVKEYYDSMLKAGHYNNLRQPAEDFPMMIGEEGAIDPKMWQSLSELFDEAYPNTIQVPPGPEMWGEAQVVKKQFAAMGKQLQTFQ